MIEEKIKAKLDYLNGMLEKYQELNHKTHGKYRYRENAIVVEIEVLVEMLTFSEIDTEWNTCYEEDKRESGA